MCFRSVVWHACIVVWFGMIFHLVSSVSLLLVDSPRKKLFGHQSILTHPEMLMLVIRNYALFRSCWSYIKDSVTKQTETSIQHSELQWHCVDFGRTKKSVFHILIFLCSVMPFEGWSSELLTKSYACVAVSALAFLMSNQSVIMSVR